MPPKGKLWKCACGALNESWRKQCDACATSRAGVEAFADQGAGPLPQRMSCDCGASLNAKGVCERFGGYPATSRCPFACPVCSAVLDWSGGCDQCHGCTGRRDDWRFPGDRYELEKGHWQRVDGPRAACSSAENARGFAAVRAILGAGDERRGTPSRVGIPAISDAVRAEVARREGTR